MTPLVLVLPWEYLVPDNSKYGVVRGRMLLTRRYRDCKDALYCIALAQRPKAWALLTDRVCLHATFYERNRSRTRDVTNYGKILCDALKGVAYLDDGQIDDARYIRGPVDAVNPRVVLTISPLTPTEE